MKTEEVAGAIMMVAMVMMVAVMVTETTTILRENPFGWKAPSIEATVFPPRAKPQMVLRSIWNLVMIPLALRVGFGMSRPT
jgi:hypothetical protein